MTHAPAESRFARPLPTAVIAVVLVAAVTALALARLPAHDEGVAWAEDGRVFLKQRYELGIGGSLFHPYGGYLQFVPRILTGLATLLQPLTHYATTVTVLSCLTAGLVGGLVFVCSRDVVTALPARIVLALITVLVPAVPVEILGNMANAHWLLLWLAPWILLYRPDRWWISVALAAVMLALVLSEIQVAFFLPLLVFSLRRRKSWPISAALIVGIAAQAVATLSQPRLNGHEVPISAVDVIKGFIAQVVMPIYSPNDMGQFIVTHGWKAAALGAVPMAAAAAFLIVRARRFEYVVVGTLLWGAVVPWVAASLVNAQPVFQYDGYSDNRLIAMTALRHAVVPSMFLLALVVAAADRLLDLRTIPPRIVAVVVLAAVIVVQLQHFEPAFTRRAQGPTFSTEMERAVAECRAGGDTVTMPGSPRSFPVVLPCSVVVLHGQ